MFKYLRMVPSFINTVSKLNYTMQKQYRHLEKYDLDDRYKYYKKYIALLMKKTFKVEIKAFNIENATDNSIYTPNHIAAIDPVMMIHLLNRHVFFVGKKEAKKYPFVGKIMYNINSVFLDRHSLRDGVKMINSVSKFLIENKNSSLVIFPEGTRTKDKVNYTVGEFHPGSYKIALNTKTNIVPTCIFGTDNILNQKVHMKRYCVIIKFLKPITYEEYKDLSTEEIAKLVRGKVVNEMPFVKEQYEKWSKYYNSKEFLKGK